MCLVSSQDRSYNNDVIVTSFSCIIECLWHKVLLHLGNTNCRGTYLMSHLLVQDEKWSCDNTNLLSCQKGRGSNVQAACRLIHRVRKYTCSTKPLRGLNMQMKRTWKLMSLVVGFFMT